MTIFDPETGIRIGDEKLIRHSVRGEEGTTLWTNEQVLTLGEETIPYIRMEIVASWKGWKGVPISLKAKQIEELYNALGDFIEKHDPDFFGDV